MAESGKSRNIDGIIEYMAWRMEVPMQKELTRFENSFGRWKWDIVDENGNELTYHTDNYGDGLWVIDEQGQKAQTQGTLQFQIPYAPSDDEKIVEKACAYVRQYFRVKDARTKK